MKAAVMHGAGDIRLEDVPFPQFAADEVLIKVKCVGICGGDIHFYHGTHPYSNYPRIYGHELSGEIAAVGANVNKWNLGDRVVLEPTVACGKCYPCRIGKYNCCVSLNIIGVHSDGGFAEYVAAPRNKVFSLPDSLPFDLASLIEPYSIGAQAFARGQITCDDKVLIIGVGAIGLTLLDIAKNIGHAQVMVADLHPYRLELAKKLGADVTVNTREEDLIEKVMLWTDGEGAGVVAEATGVPSMAEMTPELVANGGRVVILGVLNREISLPGIKLTNKEMTIVGSRNSKDNYPMLIESFANHSLHPEIIMTKKFPFEKISNAFQYMEKNIAKIGKLVIEIE